MPTPDRRSFTKAQLDAEVQRALVLERAKRTEEVFTDFMRNQDAFRENHTELHAHLEETLGDIREVLAAVPVISDPKQREQLPDMVQQWIDDKRGRRNRQAFFSSWKGTLTFLTGVAMFALVLLTSLGVLPPKPAAVPAPIPSPSASHTP